MKRWVTWLFERLGPASVDPDACRRLAEQARAAEAPQKRALSVAQRVARSYARRAALHGSVAGLPLGPLRWLAAYLDAQNMARTRLELPATLAYLADPAFFDRADWRDRVDRWADAEAPHLSPATVTLVSRLGRRLAAKALRGALAPRASGRLIVPAGSSSLFALWNYVEVHWSARPAIARYRADIAPKAVRRGKPHLRAVG